MPHDGVDDAGKNFTHNFVFAQGRGPQGRRVAELPEGSQERAQNTVGVVLGGVSALRHVRVAGRAVADGLRPSKSWWTFYGSGQCLGAENDLELDAAMASSRRLDAVDASRQGDGVFMKPRRRDAVDVKSVHSGQVAALQVDRWFSTLSR